jgi:hypothetical protein
MRRQTRLPIFRDSVFPSGPLQITFITHSSLIFITKKAKADLDSEKLVADDTTSDSKAFTVAMESRHWYGLIEWQRVFVIAGIPLLGVIGAFNVPLQRKTAWLTVAYYFVSGIALSAGKIYLRIVQTR